MPKALKHDFPIGHLDYCQICGNKDLSLIIDLGHQAPCDSLVTSSQLNQPETTYPLKLYHCNQCGLVQINHVVDPKILFHPDYPYISGITQTLAINLLGIADRVINLLKLKKNSLVIDIGSNDGTLLQGFKQKGMRVLGIEATLIAKKAEENGIPTIQAFFNENLAKEISKKYGKAAVITATNMFAHIPNLGDFLRGVRTLLVDDGFFLSESHYLLDIIKTNQYDSIYHEHLRFYSLKSLIRLMKYYNFSIVDVERIPNYGGSIRVFSLKGNHKVSENVNAILTLEEKENLNNIQTYIKFRKKIFQSKIDLLNLLVKLNKEGKQVIGIGCPGRSSTLLNYCNIDSSLIAYISEQASSLKLGLFLPGKHIPIVDEKKMFEEQPEYALLLSWHYSKPIIEKLRMKGLKSKIILPLPEVKILYPI